MQHKTLLYDGTFEGFLSCVFYVFEYKLKNVTIQNQFVNQSELFSDNETINTDKQKSDRVWKGLKQKASTLSSTKIYYAFLSEQPKVENVLLDYMLYIFNSSEKVDTDFTQPSVLKTSQIAKNVSREKHRMEAFVRFKLTKDNIYFANIEPDFNVLPLIAKHFKSRYADQKWVIYDIRRNYGLFYDLHKLDFINLDFPENFDFSKTSSDFFADEEFEFQKLWKDYFDSTNIKERKNMKLHIRHVPKRYWKYLSEKQPNL
ncbi:DNA metabolism protein [Polaribacter reichenbachii]|uniref:DNA metabolism protein n=1 Tax=Polaribacter reichenbachii TaxID=996801 RepID=A0A1B8U3K9_9FLAO|nr:TIGR03915 family putative DNA repair protein [Polaribacter reichenbachii]APZ46577.1 DNA metabolism protein [Polaribacter reichenbachii]AUC17223.1 DNA metabolism protein [Polaribacter reichenbachii]OBY66401.1 DNA metabolism protein [Polaribacter reichenbachii]